MGLQPDVGCFRTGAGFGRGVVWAVLMVDIIRGLRWRLRRQLLLWLGMWAAMGAESADAWMNEAQGRGVLCMISPSLSMVAGFDRGNGENERRICSGQAKDGCPFRALFVSAGPVFQV
jgi:hypothetical protein